MGNEKCVNSLSVRLGVEVSFALVSPKLCFDCICNPVLDLFDSQRARRPIILELSPFFECISSSEALFWTNVLSSPSLSELFVKDRGARFSNFLIGLTIFSSYSLMHASFSSFFLMSFSSVTFIAAIPSFSCLYLL